MRNVLLIEKVVAHFCFWNVRSTQRQCDAYLQVRDWAQNRYSTQWVNFLIVIYVYGLLSLVDVLSKCLIPRYQYVNYWTCYNCHKCKHLGFIPPGITYTLTQYFVKCWRCLQMRCENGKGNGHVILHWLHGRCLDFAVLLQFVSIFTAPPCGGAE